MTVSERDQVSRVFLKGHGALGRGFKFSDEEGIEFPYLLLPLQRTTTCGGLNQEMETQADLQGTLNCTGGRGRVVLKSTFTPKKAGKNKIACPRACPLGKGVGLGNWRGDGPNLEKATKNYQELAARSRLA